MPYAKRASSPAVPKRPSHAPDATLVTTSGEWIRTFAIITTDANELVADIHDRMPVILAQDDYARWLGDEPDPRDLMRPFPAGLMRMSAAAAKAQVMKISRRMRYGTNV